MVRNFHIGASSASTSQTLRARVSPSEVQVSAVLNCNRLHSHDDEKTAGRAPAKKDSRSVIHPSIRTAPSVGRVGGTKG